MSLRRWEEHAAAVREPAPYRPAPPLAQLTTLLNRDAPFQPVPLCPTVWTFRARSLVRIWEAAEELAGCALPAPFWAYPWAAGVGLARLILDRPELVRGRRVLDFGTGGGVAAIAAARAGAAAVTANDIDPWALAVTDIAALRQGLHFRMLCADLTALPDAAAGYDVVLAADLGYERATAPAQRRVLETARNAGATVLAADAGRTYFETEGLTLLAEYVIAVPPDLEGVQTRTARVYTMSAPRKPRRRRSRR